MKVAVSTEDRDNFVKNLATVLVEARLGLQVIVPNAVLYLAMPAGATT